jgi:hypothetical protein
MEKKFLKMEQDRKKEEERKRKEAYEAEEKWRNENELERIKDEISKIEGEAVDIE